MKKFILSIFTLILIQLTCINQQIQAQQQCRAMYLYSIKGNTVNFTDSSSFIGANPTFTWDFGDNSVGTGSNVSHTYSKAGIYYVCHTIQDTGCNDTYCDSIVIGASSCKAGFSYSYNNLTYNFSNYSNSTSGNANFYWDFGDGNNSSQNSPSHTYAQNGTYTVCLYMSDSAGNCYDTNCIQLTTNPNGSSCSASFKYYIQNGSVYFYGPTNLNNQLYSSYSWDFGDGNNSNIQNPTHTYNSSGPFSVCLTVNDSGCSDTRCDTLYINNSSCSVYFTDSVLSNNSIQFNSYVSGTNGQVSYLWDFGDSTTSTQANPSHTYANNGSYYVCLSISDSSCNNNYCTYIQVGTGGKCFAYFTDSIVGDTVYFNGELNGASSNHTVTYLWDFGDSTYGTGKNPVHYYTNQGIYQVCLVATDSICSSTYCTYINTTKNNNTLILQGQVIMSNTYAYPCNVYAIVYDSVQSTLTAVDSTQTDSSGNYYFKLNSGMYLIKAALHSSNSQYNNYLPTYYTNKLTWDSAHAFTLNRDEHGVDISLIAGNFAGGPGFIGGKTSQGANKTNGIGDPVSQIQINLLNQNKQAVAYTYSDVNGNFKFSNIAFGTYYIVPEMAGKKSVEYQITIDANNPSVQNIGIDVNKYYFSISTGFNHFVEKTIHIQTWPNPVNDLLNYRSEFPIEQIQVLDMRGKILSSIKNPNESVSLAGLSSGIYFIKFETKEGYVFNLKAIKE